MQAAAQLPAEHAPGLQPLRESVQQRQLPEQALPDAQPGEEARVQDLQQGLQAAGPPVRRGRVRTSAQGAGDVPGSLASPPINPHSRPVKVPRCVQPVLKRRPVSLSCQGSGGQAHTAPAPKSTPVRRVLLRLADGTPVV